MKQNLIIAFCLQYNCNILSYSKKVKVLMTPDFCWRGQERVGYFFQDTSTLFMICSPALQYNHSNKKLEEMQTIHYIFLTNYVRLNLQNKK